MNVSETNGDTAFNHMILSMLLQKC